MNYWSGNINLDNDICQVNVNYIKPSWTETGFWIGSGYTINKIVCGDYKTSIGTIRVNHTERDNDNPYYFEFKGLGEPEGCFAKDIV